MAGHLSGMCGNPWNYRFREHHTGIDQVIVRAPQNWDFIDNVMALYLQVSELESIQRTNK